MKRKNISFFILEEMEQKNIEKKEIEIKYFSLNNQNIEKQLNVLKGYYNEYYNKLTSEQELKILFSYWKNYHFFLSLLYEIITDNKKIIYENKKNIKKLVIDRSKLQIRLKTWQHLNKKRKDETLRSKKFLEQILSDELSQLKVLQNRDIDNHVKNTIF